MPSDADSPNAVVLGILRRLLDTAESNFWKKSQTYKKAYENLKKVPHELKLSELTTVKSIGPKIAEELVDGYRRYCEQTGEPFPEEDSWRKRAGGARKRTTAVEAESEDEEPAAATKRRKPKEYMPKRRSGAYALLLALYIEDKRFGSGTYVSREDVIATAQEYCDSSFTENARGTHYSAWGSMKTLKDKNLVHAKGRPERFTLTDSGADTARKIYNAEGIDGGKELTPERRGRREEEADEEEERPPRQALQTRSPAAKRKAPKTNSLFADDEDEWPEFTNLTPRGTRTGSPPRPPSPKIRNEPVPKPSNSKAIELISDSEDDVVPPLGRAPTANSRFVRQPSVPSQTSLIMQPPSRAASMAPEEPLPTFSPTTFSPGSFDVELIIDNREKSSRANPDYMQQTLARKHNIQAITRPLAIGDIQWVAKHKTSGKEVMLDFIVERKRLDDLQESIKDGRYTEQKTRLRKTGMSNIVYIVEEYVISGGSERALTNTKGIGMEAVNTAIASTQVVEGIFVKQTKKVDDTLRYLANITSRLQRSLEGQTLYIIPNNALDIKTYPRLKAHLAETQPDKSYHVEFGVFQEMLNKTAETDLRTVFIRMLMCIKGITALKAVQIQGVYQTPAGLAKAYAACKTKEARDTLIMREVTGVGKRATTRSLSVKVADMWA